MVLINSRIRHLHFYNHILHSTIYWVFTKCSHWRKHWTGQGQGEKVPWSVYSELPQLCSFIGFYAHSSHKYAFIQWTHKGLRLQRWGNPGPFNHNLEFTRLSGVVYSLDLVIPAPWNPLNWTIVHVRTWGSVRKGNWRRMGQNREEARTWYQGKGNGPVIGTSKWVNKEVTVSEGRGEFRSVQEIDSGFPLGTVVS